MFAIYIPGRHRNDVAILREVGAGWAIDPSVTSMFLDVEIGPDGGAGKLVYFDSRRFVPGQVTSVEQANWLPAAKDGDQAEGRYWVGVSKERKPGPDELERASQCDGPKVALLDGNAWTIPVADYLPKRLTINRSTGKQEDKPLDEHCEFIARTNDMFRHLISDEFQHRVQEELLAVVPDGLVYASLALGKNYRVNLDLVDALGLIGDFEALKIAGVATSLDLLASIDGQKKSRLLAMSNCGS